MGNLDQVKTKETSSEPSSDAKLLRAVSLAAQLQQRRNDLIQLFGEETYRQRVEPAKERVREVMATHKDDNPINAAIRFCNEIEAKHHGEDVSTIQQFVLAAATELAAL